MIPVSCFNQPSFQVATHAVSILRYRGNFNGNTQNRWLMLFNSVVAAVNGAVPTVPAIPLFMTQPFFSEFEIGALEFPLGCWVAVSSTQEVLTLSTDTMDFSAELSDPEAPSSTTFVGNLQAALTSLQVWSEAAGTPPPTGAGARKRLFGVEVDGTNLTAPAWVQIWASDAQPANTAPIFSYPIAVGQKRTASDGLRFGGQGMEVYSNDNTTTPRYGCTIIISGSPSSSTPPTGTCAMRAEFK